MGTHAQTLLNVLATPTTLLCREARGDADDLMTSSCSFILKDTEERAPTRVVNAFREMVVLYHPADVQVFYADAATPLGVVVGRFEVKVAALATDLEVFAHDFPVGRAAEGSGPD